MGKIKFLKSPPPKRRFTKFPNKTMKKTTQEYIYSLNEVESFSFGLFVAISFYSLYAQFVKYGNRFSFYMNFENKDQRKVKKDVVNQI